MIISRYMISTRTESMDTEDVEEAMSTQLSVVAVGSRRLSSDALL